MELFHTLFSEHNLNKLCLTPPEAGHPENRSTTCCSVWIPPLSRYSLFVFFPLCIVVLQWTFSFYLRNPLNPPLKLTAGWVTAGTLVYLPSTLHTPWASPPSSTHSPFSQSGNIRSAELCIQSGSATGQPPSQKSLCLVLGQTATCYITPTHTCENDVKHKQELLWHVCLVGSVKKKKVLWSTKGAQACLTGVCMRMWWLESVLHTVMYHRHSDLAHNLHWQAESLD